MPVFALTIFTGAFLLFQVQPLIAKYILPWFGGGPGVWTTCMLFFQVLLLGGYAYAHCTSRWLKPRAQVIVHLALLAAALALLPVTPTDSWKPSNPADPTWRILALLAATLGLPYFVLSATGPLLQQWFSRSHPGRSPYRLYALSNVGSLLALISYPFFFETHFTRKAQAGLWGGGLAFFVVCCAACALKLWKSAAESGDQKAEEKVGTLNAQPSAVNYVLWLLLPACASLLLLATTNKMCQDVAVMPFLWVLPLSIYLLSFIICFDSPRWYEVLPFRLALLGALGALYWAIPQGSDTPLLLLLAVYSAALFVCCMVCHGELYRLKPEPDHLTAFYLMIAAGGALGGLLAAVVAPLIFHDYYELHWGALACGGLLLVTCARDRSGESVKHWRWVAWLLPVVVLLGLDRLVAGLEAPPGGMVEDSLMGLRVGLGIGMVYLGYLGLESRALDRPGARVLTLLVLVLAPWSARRRFSEWRHWRRATCSWLGLGLGVLGAGLWQEAHHNANLVAQRVRNFYGVLTLIEAGQENASTYHRSLLHGQVLHGLQLMDPVGTTWPTTYFGPNGGAGLAMQALAKGGRRIGVAGLGIGTLAVYARTNDYFRFYEINPEALRMAREFFTYLKSCRGTNECVLGDARLSLEQEPAQQFDLLVLDAFAGDSPPAHLLTKEAFRTYDRHLKTNGVIAANISNKYLNLQPVLVNVARELGFHFAIIENNPWALTGNPGNAPGRTWWLTPSLWVLLTRDPDFLNDPAIRAAAKGPEVNPERVRLWTDDFTSLFQVLR